MNHGEPAPADEEQCAERAGHGTGTHRGAHQADAGLAGMEQLKRHDHKENIEAAARKGLGEGKSDQQPGVTMTRERTEPGAGFDDDPPQLQ